jgi:hypothetical protein
MNLANVFATGVLATLGFAVIAQTPAPAPAAAQIAQADRHGDSHHGGMDPAQRQERFTRRMAELKQKLQITPAQESAWTSFTTAMRPTTMRSRMDRDALARLSTPDRIDQMRALRNERMAQMDRQGDAVKAFYATLDAQQKKLFDETAARHGRHHGHLKG